LIKVQNRLKPKIINNKAVFCERKGILIPGEKITLPAISEKDISDIHFACKNELDFIAASFIRTAK
jgi:pyruvate kinase